MHSIYCMHGAGTHYVHATLSRVTVRAVGGYEAIGLVRCPYINATGKWVYKVPRCRISRESIVWEGELPYRRVTRWILHRRFYSVHTKTLSSHLPLVLNNGLTLLANGFWF